MPLTQYFGWVGGFLLAALLAVNWFFPSATGSATSDIPLDEKINIRIHTDRKWPERIVFDTTRSIPKASSAPEADEKPAAAAQTANAALDAFAEMTATPFNERWSAIFPSQPHRPRGKS